MKIINRFTAISILIFAILGNQEVRAEDLSPSALFARCYGHLTGLPVPRDSALMVQVKDGSLQPIAACLQIFNRAMLGSNGMVTGTSADKEAVAIINRFQNFHRTWFSATKIEDIIDFGRDTGPGTADVYDATEPALALTYHLFKPGAKYQDVLRTSQGFVAQRMENETSRARLGYTITIPNRRVYGNNVEKDKNLILTRKSGLPEDKIDQFAVEGSYLLTIAPKIQVGDLVGIVPQTQSFVLQTLSLTPLGPSANYGERQPGLNFTFNIYNSFGGGVLGQPIYNMMNIGHAKGTRFTGAEKLPRRWAYNSMQTFLCAQFPTLREADALPFLDASGTAPFRKSASCLQCHATMDRAAFTARNLLAGGSEFTSLPESFDPTMTSKPIDTITSFRGELPAQSTWPSSAAPDFHRQSPSGTLYFRSVTSELVNRNVQGISGLGEAMSDTDDYYQCAAKRYFEYFTGINVALYDRTDPRYAEINKNLTSENLADRKYIETLAASFRASQSLPDLIQQILNSSYYRAKNFRPSGGL